MDRIDSGEIDEAIRTLYSTFWSSKGWKRPPEWPDPERFKHAIAAGIMFDAPRTASHDETVAAARHWASKTDPKTVGDAFISSLMTRRLELRSALGSYAVLRRLPAHRFMTGSPRVCAICGLFRETSEDLNVLNFERFKWGGVRRDSLIYAMFDLEHFSRVPRVTCDESSRRAGREILDLLRTLPETTTATQAAVMLRMLPGNKAEREVLLDILGVCGILESRDHPGYSERFIEYRARDLPNQRFIDRAYPACWWTAADGVNEDAVRMFLPQIAR